MSGRPKIRKDDNVIVIGGKDRGKTGRVLRVDPKRQRVFVEGANIVKKHIRPQQVQGAQRAEQVGGVVEKEGGIHISNVALIDPKENKPTRVRLERDEDGTRRRVAKRSGARID
ncbi:MAG: large subunit ribosomal protein [Solirubrobacteraceae bacterium]|jgi:large subunit ribosomal protein L24|nr:large subunit ribosomal protein [Solirubrobacteraceae bacterium]